MKLICICNIIIIMSSSSCYNEYAITSLSHCLMSLSCGVTTIGVFTTLAILHHVLLTYIRALMSGLWTEFSTLSEKTNKKNSESHN